MTIQEEGYEMRRQRAKRRKQEVEMEKKKQPQKQSAPTKSHTAERSIPIPDEPDNLDLVARHPLTKVILGIGLTLGALYLSSFLFQAAAKAAISYHKFRQATQGRQS